MAGFLYTKNALRTTVSNTQSVKLICYEVYFYGRTLVRS